MDKKLEEYEQTHPLQLAMFQVADHVDTKRMLAPNESPEHSKYSNTFEFFDGIPKYVYSKSAWKDGDPVFAVEREFEHSGRAYAEKITPAMLAGKDKVLRPVFPGARERYVFDALIKLSLQEDKGVFLSDRYGIKFHLRQLYRELKEQGRMYSILEIVEALRIMRGASYQISALVGEKRKLEYSFSIISELGLATLDDWRESQGEAVCYVRLNQMAHDSIMHKSYRLYNYVQNISYRSVIASDLHKRMSHRFTQAAENGKPYSIRVSTIIRDFGLTRCAQFRDNVRQVQAALEEMKQSGVVAEYKIEPEYGYKGNMEAGSAQAKRRTKPNLVDAMVHITPSGDFCHEVFIANGVRRKITANDLKTLKMQYPNFKKLSLFDEQK